MHDMCNCAYQYCEIKKQKNVLKFSVVFSKNGEGREWYRCQSNHLELVSDLPMCFRSI
jgi:hypothetical protein